MSIPGQAPNHRTISIEKSNYTLICIVVLFFIAVIYIGKILTSHTYYMKDDLNEIRNYAGTPIYRTQKDQPSQDQVLQQLRLLSNNLEKLSDRLSSLSLPKKIDQNQCQCNQKQDNKQEKKLFDKEWWQNEMNKLKAQFSRFLKKDEL